MNQTVLNPCYPHHSIGNLLTAHRIVGGSNFDSWNWGVQLCECVEQGEGILEKLWFGLRPGGLPKKLTQWQS